MTARPSPMSEGNTPSIDDRELIAGIVTRTISRLQALHDYAGRPSWEEVIAEEMRGVLESLLSERDKLEEAATKARNKFLHYEDLHRLKCTAEGDEKADRNREMSDMLTAALNRTANNG